MLIYIAGPYTKGDVAKNVRDAIYTANSISAIGHVPFVPHLTHFWHLLIPHEIEFWYRYDMFWLEKCDAVYRLPGESVGADKEVERAKELGKPVFYSFKEVVEAT